MRLISEEIKDFIFDTRGRLNYRRFKLFSDKFPKVYQEIITYTKNLQLLDSSFRFKFLTWYHEYTNDNLICRLCHKSVKWTHHKPNTLCSNECRKKDGINIGKTLIQSNITKYGVNSTSQLQATKEKFKKTLLKNNHIKNKEHYYDKKFIETTFLDNDLKFSYRAFCNYFGVIQPTAHNHINRLGIKYVRTLSGAEKEIQLFIKDLSKKIVQIHNSRKIIKPLELDIYLPEYNLAIEYNGLYWHSYGLDNNPQKTNHNYYYYKTRHISKTMSCLEKSISLLNIYENEWNDPYLRNIWQSIIRYKLRLITDKKSARKLKLVYYKGFPDTIKTFLFNNHLQGAGVNSSHVFALQDPDTNELLQVMTFGKSRYNSSQYEILRLATKLNTVVRGGSSRLLKAFETQINPESLHTFADLRFSNGDIYKELGFTFINQTTPNFKVFKKNTQILEPREKFQKHKLKTILPNFNPELTAIDNLINNGYRVIWDCGNLSYKKEYHDYRQ